jgi:hypothetical protein
MNGRRTSRARAGSLSTGAGSAPAYRACHLSGRLGISFAHHHPGVDRWTRSKKRRYRYYRIASPLVARMLESIKAVAAIEVPPRHKPRSAQDAALRFARTCYDHLAGQLGVAIADALVANRLLGAV